MRDAGIVDEDIDAMRRAIDLRKCLSHRCELRYVASNRIRLAARFADFLGRGISRIEVRLEDKHARAIMRESIGDRVADTGTRAGDYCNFIVETEHRRQPRSYNDLKATIDP